MKILYITTVSGTMDFFVNIITDLVKKGNTVDIACSTERSELNPYFQKINCKHLEIECSRKISVKSIFNTVHQIKTYLQKEKYDVIHCHTPIASVCARLASRKYRKKGLRVIYTAHGFHFFKGSSHFNWMVYYPIEKLCARFTDTIITINTEDYDLAKRKLKCNDIRYIPGVGIDINRIQSVKIDKKLKRASINVPLDAYTLLTVGDLNDNKNQSIIIKAISNISNPNIHYVLAGTGEMKSNLVNLAKELKVDNRVHFLGYRTDIFELYQTADALVAPSKREGLSVSIMEAMASGLPVICSDIRGNRDLIDSKGGILCDPKSINDFEQAISKLAQNKKSAQKMSEYNQIKITKFSEEEVIPLTEEVYNCN